jgi:hypothetical protein
MLTFLNCRFTKEELNAKIANWKNNVARYEYQLENRDFDRTSRARVEADLVEALDVLNDYERELAFYFTNKR